MGPRGTSSSLWLRARLALRPRSALASLVAACLVHGLSLRALAAASVLRKWGNTHQQTWWVLAAGLSVGVLEDACVCLGVCTSLWLVGGVFFKSVFVPQRLQVAAAPPSTVASSSSFSPASSWASSSSLLPAVLLVATHFVLANAALCVDLVFLRTRAMRFRWDFVLLLWRESRSDAWRALEVDEAEWLLASQMGAVTLLFALALALRLDDRAAWTGSPLPEWDRLLWRVCVDRVAQCSHLRPHSGAARTELPVSASVCVSSSPLSVPARDDDDREDSARLVPRDDEVREEATRQSPPHGRDAGLAVRLARLVVLWASVTMATVGVTKCVPSVVAMLAWNATLCEPLRVLAGVECSRTRAVHIGKRLSELIDTTTEKCAFVDDKADSLVRRTLGFQGPTAFDVAVAPDERPNVLVVVIESFRQRDSRYLVDPRQLDAFLPGNVSLTPYFDQWAKRGVAFRNMWSSWRTSRSLEQILFGQLPLDSATDSGTSNGRSSVRLSGMPQLLKAKGYDTLFTTGSRLDYDDWDTFLRSHGFDVSLNGWGLADIGLDEMGIDWTVGDHVMAFWGIHDDVTFEVLGHILKARQREKRASPEGKPWFATHYTISSHVPFDERPDWFFRMRHSKEMPDFSPLYAAIEDAEIRELVKNYAEMRYFSDLAFGSFMGDLERSGVLNDTIVVVTGDHGSSPESGAAMPEEDQVGAMHVAAALIAEGRLGQSAGTVVNDTVAHYDWLNTVADIVGVPDGGGGFLQTGIGRSLKRKPVGEHRVVYSHNPAMNLAAVQGHTRMEFFADVPDVVRVYNVERDPKRQHDLMGDLPKPRLHEIHAICDEARALNAYFTQRWDAACMLPPQCGLDEKIDE